MKNRMVILLIASAFLFTGCQAVFKAFVGFKPMERFDPGKYEAFVDNMPKDVPFTSIVSSVEQSLAVIEFDTKYQRVYPEINGDGEYTIIVYWTNVLPKISRSAIKTVFANLKEFQQVENCQVYLINDDQFLIDNMKEESSSNN